MSIIKKLAGQTAVYGLSSIVGRFLNYLLVPLYTGIFKPADYGVSSWFYAFASFAAVIFTYGMETAFFRFANKSEKPKEVFSTTMISILISSLVIGGCIILFATPIAQWTKNEGRESFFIYFTIILAADAISTIPFAWLRLQNEPMRFAMLRLLSIGVNIGLNLLFYLVIPFFVSKGVFAPLDTEGVDLKWMFIANVASSVVVLPFFMKEFKMIRQGFDKKLWEEMMIYSFPLIFMGFAGMINETLDRMLLKWLIPDQTVAEFQTGIYSANYKLSILITLFIQAFRFAAEPFFFARAKEEDSKKIYAQVMQYFTIICATIFLVVMLYLDIFKYFIRKPIYWEGLKVVPILLMANIFLGMYYNLSIWYKLTDKTRLGAVVSIMGAVITLILNWLWIPKYGYEGCAWTTLICYLSMAWVSYSLGQKYYPVPYPLKRIASFLALSLSIYIISDMLRETFGYSSTLALFVNTLLFALYCFVIFKMEKTEIMKIVKSLNLKKA
jgi:O-antigen/teichoic acid export membrane protein